jgi:hypothetical protein
MLEIAGLDRHLTRGGFKSPFDPICRASVSDAALGRLAWRFTETPYKSTFETASKS